MKGKPTAYPCHDVKCRLSDGTVILWNCIQGYSTEDRASMCLRPLTAREAAEVAEIEADDDGAFSEECERERVALLHMDVLELEEAGR